MRSMGDRRDLNFIAKTFQKPQNRTLHRSSVNTLKSLIQRHVEADKDDIGVGDNVNQQMVVELKGIWTHIFQICLDLQTQPELWKISVPQSPEQVGNI
jgi:hypothetical protein